MKFNYLLLLTVFVTGSVFGQGIQFEKLPWREALAKAKKENKLLFVDAYAKWCGPCKVMAKKEFTKVEVGDYFNEKFVNLKLDMEETDGKTFDAQYPVSAYPTMFFIDGDGNVIERIKGARKGDALIAAGEAALSRVDLSGDYKKGYEAGDRSYDLVYNYVRLLNIGGKPSLKISNDYLNDNPDISKEQRLRFVHEAAIESDSRIYTEMMDNKKAIIKLVGEEDYTKKVLQACYATVDKAIEYQEEFLLEEAIEASNKGLRGGAKKEFHALAHMRFASAMKDADMYKKYLGKARKYFRSDIKKLKSFVTDITTFFGENTDLLDTAIDISKYISMKEISIQNLRSYVHLLIKNKREKEALEVLNEAMQSPVFSDRDKQGMQQYIDKLEKSVK